MTTIFMALVGSVPTLPRLVPQLFSLETEILVQVFDASSGASTRTTEAERAAPPRGLPLLSLKHLPLKGQLLPEDQEPSLLSASSGHVLGLHTLHVFPMTTFFMAPVGSVPTLPPLAPLLF